MRRSSPPSVSSCMVNGGVIDLLRMVNSVTSNSISPVGILLFLLLRSLTVPVTCKTNSRPRGLASRAAFRLSLKSNWVIPYRSRRSTKLMLPNLRTVCTQPARVTVSFLFSSLNWPQVCVLNMLKKLVLIAE